MLRPDEAPTYVRGYDYALSGDNVQTIREGIVPHVQKSHPELEPLLEAWI
jgi:hypothetical protein